MIADADDVIWEAIWFPDLTLLHIPSIYPPFPCCYQFLEAAGLSNREVILPDAVIVVIVFRV